MMAILEMALWIIATPILLFVGRVWLGFILGLLSYPGKKIKKSNEMVKGLRRVL